MTSLDFSANLNEAKHTPQIRPKVTHIKRNLPAFVTNTLVRIYVKICLKQTNKKKMNKINRQSKGQTQYLAGKHNISL